MNVYTLPIQNIEDKLPVIFLGIINNHDIVAILTCFRDLSLNTSCYSY